MNVMQIFNLFAQFSYIRKFRKISYKHYIFKPDGLRRKYTHHTHGLKNHVHKSRRDIFFCGKVRNLSEVGGCDF